MNYCKVNGTGVLVSITSWRLCLSEELWKMSIFQLIWWWWRRVLVNLKSSQFFCAKHSQRFLWKWRSKVRRVETWNGQRNSTFECHRSSIRRFLCTNVLVYARACGYAHVTYRSDENNYAHSKVYICMFSFLQRSVYSDMILSGVLNVCCCFGVIYCHM